MTDAREGPHKGAWQCAFENKTPRAANRSILGVLALGCPSRQPSQVFKSSTAIISTLGGTVSSTALSVLHEALNKTPGIKKQDSWLNLYFMFSIIKNLHRKENSQFEFTQFSSPQFTNFLLNNNPESISVFIIGSKISKPGIFNFVITL